MQAAFRGPRGVRVGVAVQQRAGRHNLNLNGDARGTISLITEAMKGHSVACSRRSARRSITTAPVGLLALGFLASYAGYNTSSSSQSSAAASAPDQTTTVQLTSGDEDRLGCGSYCQNAGGYGGAGGATPHLYAVTVVSSGTVTADPDGYVPVTLTCNLSVQCRGALLVSGTGGASIGGRSDLVVDAGATRKLGVPLGSSAIGFLRSNGPTTVNVNADARDSGMINGLPGGVWAINLTNYLTVAAPG